MPSEPKDFHSFERAYETSSERESFYGFFTGFSYLQNHLCQNCLRLFGSEMSLVLSTKLSKFPLASMMLGDAF